MPSSPHAALRMSRVFAMNARPGRFVMSGMDRDCSKFRIVRFLWWPGLDWTKMTAPAHHLGRSHESSSTWNAFPAGIRKQMKVLHGSELSNNLFLSFECSQKSSSAYCKHDTFDSSLANYLLLPAGFVFRSLHIHNAKQSNDCTTHDRHQPGCTQRNRMNGISRYKPCARTAHTRAPTYAFFFFFSFTKTRYLSVRTVNASFVNGVGAQSSMLYSPAYQPICCISLNSPVSNKFPDIFEYLLRMLCVCMCRQRHSDWQRTNGSTQSDCINMFVSDKNAAGQRAAARSDIQDFRIVYECGVAYEQLTAMNKS